MELIQCDLCYSSRYPIQIPPVGLAGISQLPLLHPNNSSETIYFHRLLSLLKMAIENTPLSTCNVSTPSTISLPDTETSKPVLLEPYHVDLLPEYGYLSQEFLISGVAHGESFCTRLLLRRPADISKFSGFVVEEPSHLWGGTSIWRHINRWLMRNGMYIPNLFPKK